MYAQLYAAVYSGGNVVGVALDGRGYLEEGLGAPAGEAVAGEDEAGDYARDYCGGRGSEAAREGDGGDYGVFEEGDGLFRGLEGG